MPIAARLPPDEETRLDALWRYDILDTAPDPKFDRVTSLAADLFAAPICLVSLVDRERQWFKSRVGLDALETPRDLAFCAYAILGDEVFVVPDATADSRFADSPLVLGPPFIRTYAGAPLVTPDGAHLGTLCIIYDRITEISSEMRTRLSALADIVVDALELHRSLAETTQAQAAAEASASAKSRFLANMGHEIRTPLNGVIGMLDLMVDDDLPPSARERAGLATRAAHDLLTLLNDILDYSRLDSSQLRLETIPVDLVATAQQVVDLFGPMAAEKGLSLFLSVGPGVPAQIDGDPTRLRQILTNLISNAIKFTETGRIDVRVTRVTGSAEDEICYEVADTGIGIDPADAASLFGRFVQADESTSRNFGGSGLGLAICSELVALMNGRIGADGTPGEGSRFWFTLPVMGQTDMPATGRAEPALPTRKTRLRVLIAEDNKINQHLLQAFVEKDGHEATLASDGVEALERVRDGSFDVVLMDDQMPVMDGITALRQIRALGAPVRDLPVIMITAAETDGKTVRYDESGANGFLAKPIDPRALASMLERCGASGPDAES